MQRLLVSNELIGGLDASFGLISVSDGVPVLTGSTMSDCTRASLTFFCETFFGGSVKTFFFRVYLVVVADCLKNVKMSFMNCR